MKTFLLKLFASETLKSAVATALQVAGLAVDAMRGVLMGDGISDERRKQIQVIFDSAISIRDFLAKLALIIGAPAMSSISSLDHLAERTSRLDDLIEKL